MTASNHNGNLSDRDLRTRKSKIHHTVDYDQNTNSSFDYNSLLESPNEDKSETVVFSDNFNENFGINKNEETNSFSDNLASLEEINLRENSINSELANKSEDVINIVQSDNDITVDSNNISSNQKSQDQHKPDVLNYFSNFMNTESNPHLNSSLPNLPLIQNNLPFSHQNSCPPQNIFNSFAAFFNHATRLFFGQYNTEMSNLNCSNPSLLTSNNNSFPILPTNPTFPALFKQNLENSIMKSANPTKKLKISDARPALQKEKCQKNDDIQTNLGLIKDHIFIQEEFKEKLNEMADVLEDLKKFNDKLNKNSIAAAPLHGHSSEDYKDKSISSEVIVNQSLYDQFKRVSDQLLLFNEFKSKIQSIIDPSANKKKDASIEINNGTANKRLNLTYDYLYIAFDSLCNVYRVDIPQPLKTQLSIFELFSNDLRLEKKNFRVSDLFYAPNKRTKLPIFEFYALRIDELYKEKDKLVSKIASCLKTNPNAFEDLTKMNQLKMQDNSLRLLIKAINGVVSLGNPEKEFEIRNKELVFNNLIRDKRILADNRSKVKHEIEEIIKKYDQSTISFDEFKESFKELEAVIAVIDQLKSLQKNTQNHKSLIFNTQNDGKIMKSIQKSYFSEIMSEEQKLCKNILQEIIFVYEMVNRPSASLNSKFIGNLKNESKSSLYRKNLCYIELLENLINETKISSTLFSDKLVELEQFASQIKNKFC